MGVSCIEATVEAEDTAEEVCAALAKLQAQYLVVKTPLGRLPLYGALQSKGFAFAEALFSLHSPIARIFSLCNAQEEALPVSWALMTQKDIARLIEAVRLGMFTTDRVSLDTQFSAEQAANRYIGWIQDEITRGAIMLQLYHKEQPVGFCGLQVEDNGNAHQFLTGIYPAYQGKGLGYSLLTCAARYIQQGGGSTFTTSVSSNNEASFRTHIRCGCMVSNAQYVFIKHFE